jgi:hypothetical protein
MRIEKTYFFKRWTRSIENEPMKLEVFVLGTEQELDSLIKLIEQSCANSEETRQKTT